MIFWSLWHFKEEIVKLKVVSRQQVSKASPVAVDQQAQFKAAVVQERAQ